MSLNETLAAVLLLGILSGMGIGYLLFVLFVKKRL